MDNMEHVTLTPESVLAALEAIVMVEGGDYVYDPSTNALGVNQCFYVRDGEPSCIMGRLLAAHGVPLDVLSSYDATIGGGMSVEALINELRTQGLSADSSLARHLDELQGEQDCGLSWGRVLDEAYKYFS